MLTRVDDIRRAPSVYASGKPLIGQMINHSFQTYCMSLNKIKTLGFVVMFHAAKIILLYYNNYLELCINFTTKNSQCAFNP